MKEIGCSAMCLLIMGKGAVEYSGYGAATGRIRGDVALTDCSSIVHIGQWSTAYYSEAQCYATALYYNKCYECNPVLLCAKRPLV